VVGNAAHEDPFYHLAMLRPQGAGSAVDELRQKRMVTHEHSKKNRHEAANRGAHNHASHGNSMAEIKHT